MIPALIAVLLARQAPPMRKGLTSRTPILTYHDMLPVRTADSLWFDCSVSEFESQLAWLTKRGAHFVSTRQIYDHLTKGTPLPSHAIAITFADNYLGFYTNALPVLRRRRIPVTMFVHTDYVGSPIGRPKMSWTQLKELDQEGLVTVASQTRSHPADLRTLSDDSLRREMAGSKSALEKQLGHAVDFLAYPNGKFDARVARVAEMAGYKMAFTERLNPAETSPNIFMVARYVHTKYRQAWVDAYGR